MMFVGQKAVRIANKFWETKAMCRETGGSAGFQRGLLVCTGEETC